VLCNCLTLLGSRHYDGQVIVFDGQADGVMCDYSECAFKPLGEHMLKYVALTMLVLLTVTCAIIEGLIEGLPSQFVQLVGLLTLACTGVFVGWTLKLRAIRFTKG